MSTSGARVLSWDWYAGTIPDNVEIGDGAYIETTHSFTRYCSERAVGARFGEHSSLYKTSMLDVGPSGHFSLGRYSLVQGARIVCDAEVRIDDYVMVSWKVLIMDNHRWPSDIASRRALLTGIAQSNHRDTPRQGSGRPIHIGRGAWIGFEACVLPGVSIGEGAVVGARSVVDVDVEPFTVVAGSPLRVVRRLSVSERPIDRELAEFGR